MRKVPERRLGGLGKGGSGNMVFGVSGLHKCKRLERSCRGLHICHIIHRLPFMCRAPYYTSQGVEGLGVSSYPA